MINSIYKQSVIQYIIYKELKILKKLNSIHPKNPKSTYCGYKEKNL